MLFSLAEQDGEELGGYRPSTWLMAVTTACCFLSGSP